MKGENKITLNWTEVLTALQEYFDKRLASEHGITVTGAAASYSDNVLVVDVKGKEPTRNEKLLAALEIQPEAKP